MEESRKDGKREGQTDTFLYHCCNTNMCSQKVICLCMLKLKKMQILTWCFNSRSLPSINTEMDKYLVDRYRILKKRECNRPLSQDWTRVPQQKYRICEKQWGLRAMLNYLNPFKRCIMLTRFINIFSSICVCVWKWWPFAHAHISGISSGLRPPTCPG